MRSLRRTASKRGTRNFPALRRLPARPTKAPVGVIDAEAFWRNRHMRPSKRTFDELRPVSMERQVARYAEGSCLIKFGDTHVLCTASLEEKPPPWLRGQGRGWVTAEYAMLPRATSTRTRRESTAGKPSGRPAGAWRAADHAGLRRDPGRWWHADRGHNGSVGRTSRLPRLDART